MKIKGAIFDMDGTLLDSMSIWETLGADYLKTRGLEAPAGLREALHPLSLLQAAQYLKSEFAFPEPEEEIMRQINLLVEEHYMFRTPLKQGVQSFLKKLDAAGVKICMATASDLYLAEAALNRLGILGYFDFIITCTDFGGSKREPEIFLEAQKRLGTPKEETIVFDDALYAIKAAKSAGLKVVAVYEKYLHKYWPEAQSVADLAIASFDEWEDEQ